MYTVEINDLEEDEVTAFGETEPNVSVQEWLVSTGSALGFSHVTTEGCYPDLLHESPFSISINGVPYTSTLFGFPRPKL